MYLDNGHWIKLFVAICIICLQMLQPFIHAHLDSGTHTHSVGIHVGNEHEHHFHTGDTHQHDNQPHFVANDTHALDLVSVASGIKKDLDNGFSAIWFIIVAGFCFARLLKPVCKLKPAPKPHFSDSPRRKLPASRAPPQR